MLHTSVPAASASVPRGAGIALLALLFAAAQPGISRAEQTLRPRWEVGAGVAALSMPAYRGSDDQRGYLFPIPYLVYRGDVLKVDREKVRGLFFKSERVELDVSLNGTPPVDSDGNGARDGMADLAGTVETGPQLKVLVSRGEDYRFALYLPVRKVVTVDRSGLGAAGWLTNPSFSIDILDVGPGKGWEVGISGGPIWADARYHDYFYGVPAGQATADRPAYRPGGGYSGSHVTLAVSKRYRRLWAGAFLRANLLHGAVFEDSPLLRERAGYLAGIAVSWVFAQSRELVRSED